MLTDTWLSEVAHGFGFDLSGAFAGNPKRGPNFFKRAAAAIGQPVAQRQNLSFTFGQLPKRII
jgi:hypothetical protein